MNKTKRIYNYDVIVIGAGISGLVCACYAAKAGLKTLLIEKNPTVGGYCVSFTRRGYFFDACAHSLGSCRKNGHIDTLIHELGLRNKLFLVRDDPSDVVLSIDHKISFWSNLNRTIQDCQNNFPNESKNIDNFFNFINAVEGIDLVALKNRTFGNVLDNYFKDSKLKAMLALPVLGNGAASHSVISAVTALTIYKEFLIDGGYYPLNGMQEFSNILYKRFTEFGGESILSEPVKRIKIQDNEAKGIVFGKNVFISSRYIVSSCDATQTFLDLIGSNWIGKSIKNKITTLKPSLSLFVLYLGLKNSAINILKPGCNLWYLPHYDVEKMFAAARNRYKEGIDWFMLRLIKDDNVLGFINSDFLNNRFWKMHKKEIIEEFIESINSLFPGFSTNISFSDAATPYTLYKYTFNRAGSAYGWERSPSQIILPNLSQRTFIKNLFLAGHWSTLGHGIAGAVYSGRCTANLLIRKSGI